ncbi:lysine transporter LysE [Halomonas aestuarii]|uniref:Lysine transporter LysE n=1 Tax=Halomonas aestuarii TaxID=1897729 RepID=A0A1J0VH64_9GAMM|nr:LysE family transporter [Halomonas aestuarii]APE31349.1 lysine transporter LysE [Halomonas aestuarii]
MLESYITGLALNGGLIVSIGAQNAYLLGQAIRRQHHWWSAGVCIVSDVLLLVAGVFGITAMLLALPVTLEVMRWLGVAFLAVLGALALRRAVTGNDRLVSTLGRVRSRREVLVAMAAVTLLNPQVYLETLVVLPSVGVQLESASVFMMGSVTASVAWFALLAWGGSRLAPWLSRPAAWRAIEITTGAMMAGIAVHLASGSTWIG